MITPDTACKIKQAPKWITIWHEVKKILEQLPVTSKKKMFQALEIYFKTNDNRQTVKIKVLMYNKQY